MDVKQQNHVRAWQKLEQLSGKSKPNFYMWQNVYVFQKFLSIIRDSSIFLLLLFSTVDFEGTQEFDSRMSY